MEELHMVKRGLIILLSLLLLNALIPYAGLADDRPLPPPYWYYALYSGSDREPLLIESTSLYVTGGEIFSNHNVIHRGSVLELDYGISAVGIIDVRHDLWNEYMWEDVEPVAMPDFAGGIRPFAELGDVYQGSIQFHGDQWMERSIVVEGDVTFKGGKFTGRDYIVTSGDITFQVDSLDSWNDQPLVLYSENGDITIQVKQSELRGILYAPKGTVKIEAASSFLLEGRIFAERILLTGGDIKIHAQRNDDQLLNGSYYVDVCRYEKFNEEYDKVPIIDDYNHLRFSRYMEIQDLHIQTLDESITGNYLRAAELCHAALDKIKQLVKELEEQELVMKQIAADPDGDYDGDGLPNGYEMEFLRGYTNPTLYDTDGDGTPDGDEDSDGDGLSNLMELELGTDPAKRDTDGDGLSDGAEYRLGTDPLSADTDGNGIIDGQEMYTQTIQSAVPNVKVEITAAGDISDAVYIIDVSDKLVADGEHPILDHERFVSGLYLFVSSDPFRHAKIYLSVDRDQLGDRRLEDVKMVYWDELHMTFLPLEKQGIDPETGSVWGEAKQYGLFALFYLPENEELWQVPFVAGEPVNEAEKIFFDVMLVMDASGSMPVNDPVADRKHIAQSYIKTLIPCKEAGSAACDRAGLIAFNDFAFLLQTLTEDLDLTGAAIDAIGASGGTNIGVGVYLANQELIRHGSEDRLKVQILITDGKGPYNWKYTEEAAENGIIIYTIGLGSNRDEVNEELLKGIAISTGGRYFHAYTAKELPIVLSRIRDLLTKYQDTDGDGIPDNVEREGIRTGVFYDQLIYTDPYNPDTDGDGLLDGEEIGRAMMIKFLDRYYHYYPMYSNPTLADTDGDGIHDYDERWGYGTNPLNIDTDFDGLSDGFEINYVPEPREEWPFIDELR